MKLHTECLCSPLGLPLFIIRMIRIPEERDLGDFRCSLPKKLKTLGRECVLQQRNAGRVAAGSTETRYETELFRIGAADEYERDCLIKSLCNRGDVPADRQDHVGLESDQLGRQARKPVHPTLRIAIYDSDISSLDIAKVTQTMPDRCHLGITLRIAVKKDAELRDMLRLRLCRKWPRRRRTAEKRDELASLDVRPQAQEASS